MQSESKIFDPFLDLDFENKEKIIKALNHNKFACFCLQGKNLTYALKHFQLALETISNETFISNIFQNLGNAYAQLKDYDKAIENYTKIIRYSPYNEVVGEKYYLDKLPAELIMNPKLNSFEAYVDAHTNLAVMLLAKNDYQEAFKICKTALKLNPESKEARVNFGDMLRQVGDRDAAIGFSWGLIEEELNTKAAGHAAKFQIPQKINCKHYSPVASIASEEKDPKGKVQIVCVKWGTRYDAEYVNKLYRGILRNTTKEFEFYCFTEDKSGLSAEIIPKDLKEDWPKWWGKASLFSSENGLKGKIFYIDLDMIITGNIDSMLEYEGAFAILKTDEIACEKNNKNGFNSSVMIWNASVCEPIYLSLKPIFETLTKYVVRFDFWLEMMIENADFLQDIYPGQISDFVNNCQTKIPENTRIVCFPRTPKPDDYPAPWVKDYWI